MQRRAGMTLIEVMVAVAIVGVLAAASVPALSGWRGNLRVKGAIREISDLFDLARAQAMRTRQNHAVYIWLDPTGAVLEDESGARVAALVARDENGDGLPQSNEVVATVPIDSSASLSWGVAVAAGAGAVPTDPDPNGTYASGWTFRDPDGDPTQWVVFGPDGVPRGFEISPFDDGGTAGIGTGGGGVYLTNGTRDYAVVLSPLGTTRVHPFDPSSGTWRN